jgi:hypothetical protein
MDQCSSSGLTDQHWRCPNQCLCPAPEHSSINACARQRRAEGRILDGRNRCAARWRRRRRHNTESQRKAGAKAAGLFQTPRRARISASGTWRGQGGLTGALRSPAAQTQVPISRYGNARPTDGSVRAARAVRRYRSSSSRSGGGGARRLASIFSCAAAALVFRFGTLPFHFGTRHDEPWLAERPSPSPPRAQFHRHRGHAGQAAAPISSTTATACRQRSDTRKDRCRPARSAARSSWRAAHKPDHENGGCACGHENRQGVRGRPVGHDARA